MDDWYLFFFTRIASTEGFVVVVLLIILFLAFRQNLKVASLYLLPALGLMASVQTLKNVFRIARPEHGLIEAIGYAFPSGHAAGSAFLALSFCYFARNLPRHLRFGVYSASVLLAFTIGLSRIHFGVHTVFQVAIGYLVGALWVVIYIALRTRTK
jgi:undecaprenyl-diphosphatase